MKDTVRAANVLIHAKKYVMYYYDRSRFNSRNCGAKLQWVMAQLAQCSTRVCYKQPHATVGHLPM